ncbi:7469_t:CDS:1 [Ambispora leptoticha]|uniref:7469_t:CDS:1 n=1 Tax=Ambispora leptoticha TaxID=144679 RepID=A0A9N9DKZ2_9GLOM|nr:7469_t:CDS:1 [Ambispora leptoticha]
MNKQISLLFFLVALIFVFSSSVNAGEIAPPKKDDCCCDDEYPTPTPPPIIRYTPGPHSKVKRGGEVNETCCKPPPPEECCDCILDYCDFIPTRCDKHQRILGQIQFQQFKNCSIKATGILTKARACCENCGEYECLPLDVHVYNTGPSDIVLDLDPIATLGGVFSSWVTLKPGYQNLKNFNQYTCLVAIDTSNSEPSDTVLGTAPVKMV